MDDKVFDGLNLNEFCQQQHKDVLDKGFDNFHIPTLLMLTVTELSEACEADRKKRHTDFAAFDEEMPQAIRSMADDAVIWRTKDGHVISDIEMVKARFKHAFEKHVKDTFEDEIADAFLRLMDLCGAYGIDIERHIQMKAYYNKLRPPKHGKEY